MATVTAQDVNNLRKKTGAGMMDCKKALVEANGDFENAIDILRKTGQKIAAKRGERDANEGLVIATTSANSKNGILIVLNCETDFVAKNTDFISFANKIATIAAKDLPQNIDQLKQLSFDDNGLTIGEKIIEQIGIIGEKIDLSDYNLLNSNFVGAYNHPGNRLAAIVGVNKDDTPPDVVHQVAMQVAAMAPVSISEEDVSPEMIAREIEIGKEQAIQEGKPTELAEKISKGKLNKFFKENTLLNQQFVRDNKKSVKQFLQETDKDLTVTGFSRIQLG